MDQGSDQAGKPLSVLKGGKKETAGGTAASRKGSAESAEKETRDNTNGEAKMSTLIHGLARHMVQKTPDLPEFFPKIHVMHDSMQRKIMLEEGADGEVKVIPQDVACDHVMRFIHQSFFALGTNKLTAKNMKDIVVEFCAIAEPIPEPAMVLQKSTPGLTYRRLPFDLEADPTMERCPLFAEMMNRTTNAEALVQWIGSLFDPHADMQQYVWIYGEGQNGKSTIGRFLREVFGPGAYYTEPPNMKDGFWMYNLVGKRIVVYADCNNAMFVTSGTFKSMTGGDTVSANIKYGPTLQVTLKAKHLFFSNKRPGIDSGMADQRRIILCEMAPIEGEPDPGYDARLWAEAPYIVGECWRLYKTQAGPRRRIRADDTAARELALENDEDIDTLFASRFRVSDRQNAHVIGMEVQRILREEGLRTNKDIKRFRLFVEARYGVKKVMNSHGVYEYRGMIRASDA